MAELKPCPFCGCTDIRVARDTEAIIERHKAVCFNCSAQMYRGTEAKVTEAWNRRAESEELKFTRQFIHKHGLEFALASAWKGRAEDGK